MNDPGDFTFPDTLGDAGFAQRRKTLDLRPSTGRRSVVFYRDFRVFSGGHHSVWRYFNHVKSAPGHDAQIVFSPESLWDETNPWNGLKESALPSWRSIRPDILFLGGKDWLVLDSAERDSSPVPIVNRIANACHGQPGDVRHSFLGHKAIRICNSAETADAIRVSGRVNGPVFVIANAIESDLLPAPLEASSKDVDVLVAAYKAPALGRQLALRLQQAGWRTELLTVQMSRPEYLARVNRATVAVFLPLPWEGFYNPPLESMALNTLAICPAVPGTGHYRSGENCLRPAYALDALTNAAESALRLPAAERRQMLASGRHTVAAHSVKRERKAFLEILTDVRQLW